MTERVTSMPGKILVGAALTLDGTIQNFAAYNNTLIGLIIQAAPGNAQNVNVYSTAGDAIVHILQPGASLSVDVDKIDKIRVGGTASDVVYWAGVQL